MWKDDETKPSEKQNCLMDQYISNTSGFAIGQPVVIGLSCPCPKCSPYSMVNT